MKYLAFAFLVLFTGSQLSSSPGIVKTELYFGLSKPDGIVTEQEWQGFIDSLVVPSFKEGLTIISSEGRWLNETTKITEKEDSKIVILVYESSPQRRQDIETIKQQYISMFQQQAVLHINYNVELP